MSYYFSKVLPLAFEQAVLRTTEALKEAGFGIITEIDVKDTLKRKIDVDFRNYCILGACNPSLAYEALQIEDKVGTMLPCNVVLVGDGERTHVSIADPRTLLPGDALASLADEAAGRLSEAAGVIGRAG